MHVVCACVFACTCVFLYIYIYVYIYIYIYISAELSHGLKVSDRRRNTPKSAQNRSVSLCADLWVPCLIFWASFRPKYSSKSKISGRILKSFRGPLSSAEIHKY